MSEAVMPLDEKIDTSPPERASDKKRGTATMAAVTSTSAGVFGTVMAVLAKPVPVPMVVLGATLLLLVLLFIIMVVYLNRYNTMKDNGSCVQDPKK